MNLQVVNENLGKVEITTDVIEVISSIAVAETKGVHGLQNNFASGNIEKLGKKYRAKGVKVDYSDDALTVNIYVSLYADTNIHNTAFDIQKNVNNAIKNMTGFEVKSVNVHIINIKSE